MRPRNYYTRIDTRKKAIALGKYFQKAEKSIFKRHAGDFEKKRQYCSGQRVYGIDACSREIGCRPETFATEFRYLRKHSGYLSERYWYSEMRRQYVDIGITYHVGEDFLDIVDGLRAIDETIRFLHLRRGDRLGHAIALGIDAEEFYQFKRQNICLSKQDLLDNLVWILYRSLEFDLIISETERAILKYEAQGLLMEIYETQADFPSESLDSYYCSWLLRGDAPDLYTTGKYVEVQNPFEEIYISCLKDEDNLDKYRKMDSVTQFLYLYHFSNDVKNKGLKPAYIDLEKWYWYVDVVKALQEKMRIEVARKGIAIECNPTSNVLIGTFGSYVKHPLFSFNSRFLETDGKTATILTSINTDDLGVFDTSLENEYALILSALLRKRHTEGNYNDAAVYAYLDYLRECGMGMAFKRRSVN